MRKTNRIPEYSPDSREAQKQADTLYREFYAEVMIVAAISAFITYLIV